MKPVSAILVDLGDGGLVRESEAMEQRRAWMHERSVYFQDDTIPRAERVAAWKRLSKAEQEIIKGFMK